MISSYKLDNRYFCKNSDELLYDILNLNMKLSDISYEKEEYL